MASGDLEHENNAEDNGAKDGGTEDITELHCSPIQPTLGLIL